MIRGARLLLSSHVEVGAITFEGGSLSVSSPGAATANISGSGLFVFVIAGSLAEQQATLSVTGTVNVTGSSVLLTNSYTPAPGDVLTLISNDGTDPVVGQFPGQAEGSTFQYNGRTLRISYEGGTGNDITLTCVAAATTTQLRSMPNPSSEDETVTLTATVSSTEGTPLGTVSFYESAALLGSQALSSGTAAIQVNSLTVGQHNLTASFAPSGSAHEASTSAVHVHTVTGPPSALTSVMSANPTSITADGTSSAIIAVQAKDASGISCVEAAQRSRWRPRAAPSARSPITTTGRIQPRSRHPRGRGSRMSAAR
jgi:hypothetical protein